MTRVEDLPVRWCPLCWAASTIHEDEWAGLEADHAEIVCGNCCRVPRLWSKVRPR